jgi:hypothetical protein
MSRCAVGIIAPDVSTIAMGQSVQDEKQPCGKVWVHHGCGENGVVKRIYIIYPDLPAQLYFLYCLTVKRSQY